MYRPALVVVLAAGLAAGQQDSVSKGIQEKTGQSVRTAQAPEFKTVSLPPGIAPARAQQAFPGKEDEWNGYRRHVFTYDGRQCYVVEPKKEAAGKPWIWRARFWGHRAEVDLALLDKGYHLAYMDAAELLGNREAVAHWNKFHELLTGGHGLAKKVALEGMSRGGLYIYSWAAANPDKVACIYADAPVCDILSWPLALKNGKADERGWKMAVAAFGFKTEEEARQYKGSPIDILGPLAKARVPLLHVTGDADDAVPMEDNTMVVAQRYRALGGEIAVIVKPGIGHKHGLDDPTPIVQFIERHTLADPESIVPQFQDGDVVTFIGDSITHGRKWHRYIQDYYLTRFPDRNIRFLNAGISGDTAAGALKRLDYDVVAGNPNVAVILLGMNDVGRNLYAPGPASESTLAARRKALASYRDNMTRMVSRLKEKGVRRFVFVTPSPFDDTARIETPNFPGVNAALRQAGLFARELAVKTGGSVVDFNGPMTELNIERQKQDPAYTLVGKDRVHPGDAGMLVMAYLFLKAQDVPALVSKATIGVRNDAAPECIRCRATGVSRGEAGLTFELAESSLPVPIEPGAEEARTLVPLEAQLNQEILVTPDAEPGRYRLSIDGESAGEYTAEDLRRGVNLAFNTRCPQYRQAQAVMAVNEERRKLAAALRDVAYVEEKIVARGNIPADDAARVKAFLDDYVAKLKAADAAANSYHITMVGKYFQTKPATAEIRRQIGELTDKLRELSQPNQHHYELRRLDAPR